MKFMPQKIKQSSKSKSKKIIKSEHIFSLLILVMYCFSNICYCQNVATYLPKLNVPSSPEAALLGRFGDIPIGYYTGTADISIPIYTIKEQGIEIPIQLRYHSSGIKVADEATWVGLGWDLSPEGTIIQEVRGKRDDVDRFYSSLPMGYDYIKSAISGGSTNAYNHFEHSCSGSGESNQLLAPVGGTFPFDVKYNIEQGGAQPDIYHFNFGGHSGSFYINYETKEIVQINKTENIVFEKADNGITAKTSDGIVYNFYVIEKAYNTDVLPDDVDKAGQTYKLSSIILSNRNTIDFEYTNASSSNLRFQERYLITETCGGANHSVEGVRSDIVQNDMKILSKITTNNIIVDFVLEDRDDIIPGSPSLPNPKRLKAIDISYNGTSLKKIKTFEFGYSYFPYNTIGNPLSTPNFFNENREKLGRRLKLDTVKEIGYNLVDGGADRSMPSHKFEYDMSNTMPLKTSFSKDFWGYFNGSENRTLLPDLKYFDYEHQLPYFQPAYLDDGGHSPVNYAVPFNYGYYHGVNRYTDNSKAGAYMLKKIFYPTGGYSEFEYEPNSFTNQFIPDKIQADKAFKSTELLNNGKGQYAVNYHKDFKLSNSTTISFVNSIIDGYSTMTNESAPVYNYADFLGTNNYNGSRIVLSKTKQGVKTSIEEWNINSVLAREFESDHRVTWNEDYRIDYDPDPTVSYSVDVINTLEYSPLDTYKIASVSSRFSYYDNTGVDTSISNQGGMRVKSIKNYASAGIVTNQKNIKYTGGKLLARFEPLSAQETFCKFGEGSTVNDHYLSSVSIHNEISISSDNLVNSDGNLIGYGNVEEIEVDKNGQNNGKKVYQYHNNEITTSKNLPNIPKPSNGFLAFESAYDKNNEPLYLKSNGYIQLGNSPYFRGIININQLSGLSTSCNDQESPGVTDFTFVVYPILSSFLKLESTSTTTYLKGKEVDVTEEYSYNPKGEIRTKTITNSNQDKLISRFYYADDIPIHTTLINNNMTGIPLVTENYKDNELLSRQKTQYTADASTSYLILPKYIFAGKGSLAITSSEKKVTFDKYDAKGNIQQYTLENGASVTILWGYGKTLPIAKIENATYAQIASALNISTTSLDNYNETYSTTINNLRSNLNLPNSSITTYTHIPLIGVSTITDAKGDKITYNYDAFGRLQNVIDQDNNILSENQYQFRN